MLIQSAFDEVVAETLDVGTALSAEPDGRKPRGDRSVRHEGRKWGDVALYAGVGSGVTGHRSAPRGFYGQPSGTPFSSFSCLYIDRRELLVSFMHHASIGLARKL